MHILNPIYKVYLELWLNRHVMFHAYAGKLSTLEYVIRLSNVLCKTKNFQTWNQKCIVCVILGFKFTQLLSYLKSVTPNLS